MLSFKINLYFWLSLSLDNLANDKWMPIAIWVKRSSGTVGFIEIFLSIFRRILQKKLIKKLHNVRSIDFWYDLTLSKITEFQCSEVYCTTMQGNE